MRRGELYWGSVPEAHTVGNEQHDHDGKPRPYLIVSGSAMSGAQMVVACPMTSNLKQGEKSDLRITLTVDMLAKEAPGDDRGNFAANGTIILVDQVRVMARSRFAGSRIAMLSGGAMSLVETKLIKLFALPA